VVGVLLTSLSVDAGVSKRGREKNANVLMGCYAKKGWGPFSGVTLKKEATERGRGKGEISVGRAITKSIQRKNQ